MLTRMRRKASPVPCRGNCKLAQPLWGTAGTVLRKLKAGRPHDLAVPLLGVYPKKTLKTLTQKGMCIPMFTERAKVVGPRARTWPMRKRHAGSLGRRAAGRGVEREGGREASLVEEAPLQGLGGLDPGPPTRQAGTGPCDSLVALSFSFLL